MSLENIQKVKELSKAEGAADPLKIEEPAPIEPQAPGSVPPNKDYFEALMQQGREKNVAEIQAVDPAARKPSLMDEVSNLSNRADHIHRGNTKDLVAQAQDVIAQIDTIKDKLNTPNLELKSSVQTLLRNKLTHIDENIKIALSKAGVEYKAPEKTLASTNPIERFLGYLTDGQQRLNTLSTDVEKIGDNTSKFTPATMLAMQVKVGYIQQELEFFTSVLNKALESTKTIMNVQV